MFVIIDRYNLKIRWRVEFCECRIRISPLK